MPRGHSDHAFSPYSFLRATNIAQSSSHSASRWQNTSNACASSGLASHCFTKLRAAFCKKAVRTSLTLSKSTASSGNSGITARSDGRTMPSRTSESKLMSSGFPAKLERDWYGELPYPVGPTGSTCHSLCPIRCSVSSHSSAPRPISPMPNRPGKDVG